ncbi:MAG: hypothetical protein RL494_589 [Bacteroidota bacterium]|jgi:hypothetical protein
MRTNFLAIVFLFSGLVFTSCSKDNGNTPIVIPPIVNATQTTFKLDGVLITADETTANDYANASAGGRYIDVFVKKGGKQILELHMPATTGTYPAQHAGFSMTTSWLTYQANDGLNVPDDYYHSASGSMNLTTCDLVGNKLRGTFSFTGNNGTANKQITEGVLVVNTMTHD